MKRTESADRKSEFVEKTFKLLTFLIINLKTLGVTFSDRLDFSEHFRTVCSRAAGSMYALRVLRAHGLQGKDLWQVCEATTVSYLTYASPAWWGYADANSRQRLHQC